jgi:kynurenine formamidase
VLTAVVNSRFTFIGFPLKVVGAHGGPTQAVAIVDE